MRFHSKLSSLRIFSWLAFGVVIAAGSYSRGRSPWVCALEGLLTVAIFLPPYLFWYWDILPDSFAQRRFFVRIVMPYSEIVYVGPIEAQIKGIPAARNWIEIRNATGKRIIAQPSDPNAFLTEMRKHLPEITLSF